MADLAISELETLAANGRKKEQKFWLEKFSDFSHRVSLPYDKVGKNESGYNEIKFSFPDDTTEKLLKVANSSEYKILLTLLNNLFLLIYKYTGQENITLGVPIKKQEHSSRLINRLLFFRHQLNPGSSYKENILSLKASFDEALLHQNYPSNLLLKELSLASGGKDCSLFDIGFMIENLHEETYFEPFKPNLLFVFSISADNVECTIKYNLHLYNPTTIEVFKKHLTQLLFNSLTNTESSISDLEIFYKEERKQIWEINNNKQNFPLNSLMDSLFNQIVESKPDQIAVMCEESKVSYRELNTLSDKIALHLLELGVKKNEVIGIYLERSVDFIATIFGIIKSGAVYLPISISIPGERVKYILEDSDCKYVLTTSKFEEYINQWCKTIDVRQVLERASLKVCIETERSSDDAVYMIYTSGSTGLPKGSIITHKNVINLVYGLNSEIYSRYKENLNFALVSPFDFDASVQNIFSALLLGHTLSIAAEDVRVDGDKLIKFYHDFGVNITDGTPTHIKMILLSSVNLPASLKHLLIAGEVLPKGVVEDFYKRYSKEEVRITNLYGPTETCVDSTYFHAFQADLDACKSIPIGRPLANENLFILNEKNEVQPFLMEGEICISGLGVSRGYHNRTDLNQTKFIKSPLDNNETLYKTGDLGRLLSCGNVEFLGRIDNQVKLNGFRIELEEVEEVLNSHPFIQEAIVHLVGRGEEKALIAKIKPESKVGHPLFYYNDFLKAQLGKVNGLLELPNGLKVFNVDTKETLIDYKEVFEDKIYVKNGITISPGDTIVDAGANIGMFSLFAGLNFPGIKIYSLEPIPKIYDQLKLNSELYNLNIEPLNLGLSDTDKNCKLAFFPFCTTLSGQFSDQINEKEVVGKFVRKNNINKEKEENEVYNILEMVTKFEEVDCHLIPLSSLISHHSLDKIDLLKVDVGKCEFEALKGIEEEDWQKIRQIILEVHDLNGTLEGVIQLLKDKGFNTFIEQNREIENSNIYHVYGMKDRIPGPSNPSMSNKINVQYKIFESPDALIKEVLDYLKNKLPVYMIPSLIQLVHEMPLKPNGKINRKQAAEMVGLGLESSKQSVAPTSNIQRLMIELLKEVLGQEEINLEEDFQSMGLHSLKMMRFASKLKDSLGVKLTLQEIFLNNTIHKLTLVIEGLAVLSDKNSVPKALKKEYYPLASTQKGMFFIQHINPTSTAYNLSEVYKIKGDFNIEKFQDAFAELVNRHEALRTSFELLEGVPFQKIHPRDSLKIKVDVVKEVSTLSGEFIKSFILPFDLVKPPLMRVTIFQQSTDSNILMLDYHHIISDQQTTNLMYKELIDLYSGISLAEQVHQYVDYSEWQNSNRTRSKINETFWANQFLTPIKRMDLPYDYPRSATRTLEGDTAKFSLPEDVVKKILELQSKSKVSVYNVMLGLLNLVLYKVTNEQDIILGTSVLGRIHPDLEKVAGLFMNTCVLRNRIEPSHTFLDFLEKVKDNTAKVIEHQDFPFETIVKKYNDQKSLNRNPIFDVAYFFNDKDNQLISYDSSSTNLSIEQFDLKTNHSRFDLTFGFALSNADMSMFINYNVKMFRRETIEEFQSLFCNIAEQIISNPQLTIAELSIESGFAQFSDVTDISFDF